MAEMKLWSVTWETDLSRQERRITSVSQNTDPNYDTAGFNVFGIDELDAYRRGDRRVRRL